MKVEVRGKDRYEFTHGKRPSGLGGWAFQIGTSPNPWFAPGLLLFSEAVKRAQQEARARGATFIVVLT